MTAGSGRRGRQAVSDMDMTLTLVELNRLRRLDGYPPTENVVISCEVQPMAIRAVKEILQTRLLLSRLLGLPFAPGECPKFRESEWQVEYERLRADVLKALHGRLSQPDE
jgi:hypothetical protein